MPAKKRHGAHPARDHAYGCGVPRRCVGGVRVSDTVAVVDVIGLKTPAPAIVEPRIGNGVCRRQRREGQSQ